MRYFGWYPRRRGILEHLENGTISLFDAAVHDFLCLTADHRTGVAHSSAEKIRALCPAGTSLREAQRSLARLERIRWIKRFRTKGKHGNYPIVIGKYFVRDESLKWKSVNLERTADWRDVQFDVVTDLSFIADRSVTETGTELSPIQEVRSENREVRKKNDGEVEFESESELARETKNADEQSNHLDSAFDDWDCPPGRKLPLSTSLYKTLFIDKGRIAGCVEFLKNAETSWANSWADIAGGKFTLYDWLSAVIEHGRTSNMLYPGVFKKRLHQLERGELTVCAEATAETQR